MRILAITPIAVPQDELERRQARYDRLAPPGLTVTLENLGTGPDVPRALETDADIAASEAALLQRFASVDASGVDVFLPDCVLDPVIDHGDALPRPVLGIGRLVAHHLAGLGLRTGAVARNKAIATELDRRLAAYGLAAAPTTVMDLTLEDIADDAVWGAAAQQAVSGLECDAVINACSAVEVSDTGDGPALLDPTALALRLLALSPELLR